MKTFSLSKEELHDLNMHDYLLKRYVISIVCRRIGLDISKGDVRYDLQKGVVFYVEKPVESKPSASEQPEPENKPSEGGDKPTT